jgi:hypothetical protein
VAPLTPTQQGPPTTNPSGTLRTSRATRLRRGKLSPLPWRPCRAAGRTLLVMSTESDVAVGRLAVMDGALNDLLRDLVGEITGQDAAGMTTGKAAQVLLRHAKGDRALVTPEVTDWLKRVVEAAEKRNEVMHAVGRDQCVLCGDATRFEHKGHPIDRSSAVVEAVSAGFRDLIDEGVRYARGISDALNQRALTAAAETAAATGRIQTPKQVMIGQNLYRCAACSPGGSAIMIVQLPAPAAVLPPKN